MKTQKAKFKKGYYFYAVLFWLALVVDVLLWKNTRGVYWFASLLMIDIVLYTTFFYFLYQKISEYIKWKTQKKYFIFFALMYILNFALFIPFIWFFVIYSHNFFISFVFFLVLSVILDAIFQYIDHKLENIIIFK